MGIFVAIVRLEIFIPESLSLKSKRFILKSLKDRIRAHFNVSISEVNYQDLWQRSELAIATVSGDAKIVESTIQKVAQLVEDERRVQLLNFTVERF